MATGPHPLAKEKLTREESKIHLGNSCRLQKPVRDVEDNAIYRKK